MVAVYGDRERGKKEVKTIYGGGGR